jgi:uncharacterized protein YndB with AHSA1/START domain
MTQGLIARASLTVEAPVAAVWDALVNPDTIRRYMFGTDVKSEWKKGSSIVWKGRWQGRDYEDRGTILDLQEGHLIRYSHFSPLSGLADMPENYHTVTVELSSAGEMSTRVSLTQDNNPDEEAREHSEKNWAMMLSGMKKTVETEAPAPPPDPQGEGSQVS